MRNKKDVIVKKRKREKVKKESKIKLGKVVGIILAVIFAVLLLLLFNFLRPRVSRFNVITMRDGAVVDVGSTIEIRKSDSEPFWYINIMPGDRINEFRYTWGTDETLSRELTDIGDGYMAYLSNLDGWVSSIGGTDKRDIVIDDDLTILVVESSVYDYFSYVAYKGDPEDGAAAFAELSRYIDMTEYDIADDPFAGLLESAE